MSQSLSRRKRGTKLPSGSGSMGTYDMISATAEAQDATVAMVQEQGPVDLNSDQGRRGELKILGMVMMPEEFDAVLYSDAWTTDKMCKRQIIQRNQVSWVSQPTGNFTPLRQLQPTEQFVAGNRGIGCIFARFFYYDPNPGSALVQYTARNCKTRQGATPNTLQLQTNNNYLDFNLMDCNDTASTGAPPGSPYAKQCFGFQQVCGRTTKMNNARWFLVSATAAPPTGLESKIIFTRQGEAVQANCYLQIYRWNGNQPVYVDFVAPQAGDAVGTPYEITLEGSIGVTDFYTIEYAGDPDDTNFSPSNNYGFSLVVQSYCGQLCQQGVRSAYQNLTQLGPQTTVAASERFTDMAAPLNIQGEMAAATLRTNGNWWRFWNACLGGGSNAGSVFTVTVNYRDAYLGKLLNGAYGWHLPFKQHQFELEDCCVIDYDAAAILDNWWDLEDESAWNVYAARTTNNGNNVDTSGLGAEAWLTVVTSLNWVTDNTWPDADYGKYGYQVWAAALDSLRFVPKNMSNRHHMGTLMRWLIDKGKIALRYAKPLIEVGGRKVAEHFLGKPLADDGIKLLQDAYKVGDQIVNKLKGGGM